MIVVCRRHVEGEAVVCAVSKNICGARKSESDNTMSVCGHQGGSDGTTIAVFSPNTALQRAECGNGGTLQRSCAVTTAHSRCD
jgi:hypothetical protein